MPFLLRGIGKQGFQCQGRDKPDVIVCFIPPPPLYLIFSYYLFSVPQIYFSGYFSLCFLQCAVLWSTRDVTSLWPSLVLARWQPPDQMWADFLAHPSQHFHFYFPVFHSSSRFTPPSSSYLAIHLSPVTRVHDSSVILHITQPCPICDVCTHVMSSYKASEMQGVGDRGGGGYRWRVGGTDKRGN